MTIKKTRAKEWFFLAILLVSVCLVLVVILGRQEEPLSVSFEEIFRDSIGDRRYEGQLIRTEGRWYTGWTGTPLGEMLLRCINESSYGVIEVFLIDSEIRLEKQWGEALRMEVHVITVEGRVYYGGFYGVKIVEARIVEPCLDLWVIFELLPSILASITFLVLFIFLRGAMSARGSKSHRRSLLKISFNEYLQNLAEDSERVSKDTLAHIFKLAFSQVECSKP